MGIINTEEPREQTTAVGATPQDTFDIPFGFVYSDEVGVEVDGVEQVGFSVVGAGLGPGETREVTLAAPVTNATVRVFDNTRPIRRTSFVSPGVFSSKFVDQEFDRAYQFLQAQEAFYVRASNIISVIDAELGNTDWKDAAAAAAAAAISAANAASYATRAETAQNLVLALTNAPENFGCQGDGVTNDTANMQSYASYINAQSGIFRLTAGKTYLLDDTIRIGNDTALGACRGIEAAGARVKSQVSGKPVLEVVGIENGEQFRFDGVYIDQTDSAYIATCGILMGRPKQSNGTVKSSGSATLSNIKVYGHFHIAPYVNVQSETNQFRDCRFHQYRDMGFCMTFNRFAYFNDMFVLRYDAASAHFVGGETVTGATSGATARIVRPVRQDGTTGKAWAVKVNDTAFQDDEGITGSIAGGATIDLTGFFQIPKFYGSTVTRGLEQDSTASLQTLTGVILSTTNATNPDPCLLVSDFVDVTITDGCNFNHANASASHVAIQQDATRDPDLVVTASTISFTAPDIIQDSANGLGGFEQDDIIVITGSTGNSDTYVVDTVTAGAITVVEQTIVTEAAGPSVTITNPSRSTGVSGFTAHGNFHHVGHASSYDIGDPVSGGDAILDMYIGPHLSAGSPTIMQARVRYVGATLGNITNYRIISDHVVDLRGAQSNGSNFIHLVDEAYAGLLMDELSECRVLAHSGADIQLTMAASANLVTIDYTDEILPKQRVRTSSTLSGGDLTPAALFVNVVPASGATSSTPEQINRIALPSFVKQQNGCRIFLKANNAANVLTLNMGIGNSGDFKGIFGAGDYRLSSTVYVELVYEATAARWIMVARPNAEASQTGFTAMTGTSEKGTFATSTVTLEQLAGKVMALEAALLSADIIRN